MTPLRKYLVDYVIARQSTNPQFYGYIKWQYLKRAILILFLFPFRSKYSPFEVLVSGNTHQRFYKDGNEIGTWGISTPNHKVSLDVGRLYIATTLYVFVSRRFALILRKQIVHLRNEVRKAYPQYVAMHSDGLPVARALILALRPLGVRFICVQHGLFHSTLPGKIDGVNCDYNVIIRPDQVPYFTESGVKDFIIWSDICSSKLELGGQSFDYASINKVVLVGEGLYTISREIDQYALELYKKIKVMAKENGYDVSYRLHPSEKRSLFKRLLLLYYFGLPDQSNLVENRLFIGFNSSFLDSVSSSGGLAVRMKEKWVSTSNNISVISIQDLKEILSLNNFEGIKTSGVFFDTRYDIEFIVRKIKNACD